MKASLTLGLLLLAGAALAAGPSTAAKLLAAGNGMTVYVFDKDAGGVSVCYDDCAKKWPPYLAKGGEKMGEGWATVKRKDGSMQWTYDKKPLYFYSGDMKKGDNAGDGLGDVWHAVSE
jgi:predicted lipoprotein with Yx(FWY)xxD motif